MTTADANPEVPAALVDAAHERSGGAAAPDAGIEAWQLGSGVGPEVAEAWRDVVSQTHLPWVIDPERRGSRPYAARVERRRLGDIALVDCWCDPCSGARGKREVVATPGDYIGILMIVAGSEWVEQSDREVVLSAGDVVAWDSVDAARFVVREPLHKRTLLVPRRRFQQLLPRPELASMQRLPPSPALQLCTAYLEFIRGVELAEPAAVAAGNAALELLGAVLGSVVAPTRSAMREGTRAQARAYIEEHLAEPDLRPEAIAAAAAISVRTLYSLFEEEGDAVCAFIRRRRLARAHDELARPDASPPVTEVGYRWGFSDAAHFTRAFKAQYGYSPREARRTAG
jgi:AraC-like DNA-binding protein